MWGERGEMRYLTPSEKKSSHRQSDRQIEAPSGSAQSKLQKTRGQKGQKRITSGRTLQRTHSTASPRILQELQPDGHVHNAPHGRERPTHGTLHSVSRSHTLELREETRIETARLAKECN